MPSNADIIKEIESLSAELEKDVPETEGKNNADLANILSGLKAEKKEADKDLTPNAGAKAAAEAKAEAKAKAEEEAKAAKKPPYYVADGKAVTCKKGMLSEGDEVKAEYLADGEDGKKALSDLVKKSVVVKS
jgi:peptidoglycan hydrolase CwlO-like protein